MTDSIRSATVRLEAQVAKYIADMKAAGKVTDDAFKNSSVSAKRLDKDIAGVSTRTQELAGHSGQLRTELAGSRAEADRLGGSLKQVEVQSGRTSVAQTSLARDVERTERSIRSGEKGLDSYTGRLGLLASAVGALGPGLGPVGAVGIGGLAALASDAGLATVAVGSLVVAMHGVMPAIKAVNKAALNPTAANLQAAKLAMEQLSPAARKFVGEFRHIAPVLQQIQASAASGWFPGLGEALKELVPLAPVVETIFHRLGHAGGELAAEGAKALAGPEWHDFFVYVATEGPKALTALGHVLGSLTHGLAGLWMAFSPLNTSFNSWLLSSARDFDKWANGLSKTQGFQDFLSYVDQTGPKVAQTAGAVAHAVVQIVRAAAPLGGPTLQAITGIANAIGMIADSPLGTPILAIVQLASAMRLLKAATGGLGAARSGLAGFTPFGGLLESSLPSMNRFSASAKQIKTSISEVTSAVRKSGISAGTVAASVNGSYRRLGSGIAGIAIQSGKALAPIAAVALATSGVAQKTGLAHTATLALAGSMAGPLGTALGGTVGLVLDYASASHQAATGLDAMNAAAKSNDLQQVSAQLAAARQAQDDFVKHTDRSSNFFARWASSYGDAFYAAAHSAAESAGGYNKQIAELSFRSEVLTQKQLGVSASFVATAHAAGKTTAQLAALTAQTNAQKDAALGAFSANNAYRDALAAAEKQAKTNNAGIRGMSAAARQNSDDLATLAGAWNQNLDAMQSNGASIKQMRGRLADARGDFIRTAEAMGVPTKAARALADQLLHVPPKVNTHVQLSGAQEAIASIDHLRSLISGRPITQSIVVKRVGQNPLHDVGIGSPDLAEALLGAPHKKKAGGGLITGPGGPRDDRIPALLSNREYVMPAASVEHYGVGFMDTLRARRFADGGYVGPDGLRTYARSSGHPADSGISEVVHHLGDLRDRLKDVTKELDKEKNARSALVDKMHQLSSTVQDGLRTDLFAAGNPWNSRYASGSPAGVNATLRGDSSNIRSEIAAIKTLRSKGVTGDALGAILAQGGLDGAKAYAALSRTELATYERLYRQRDRLLHTVGALAGSAAYGGRVSSETQAIRDLQQTVRHLEHELHAANQQAHKDRKHHTASQQRGVSSAGRKNGRVGW